MSDETAALREALGQLRVQVAEADGAWGDPRLLTRGSVLALIDAAYDLAATEAVREPALREPAVREPEAGLDELWDRLWEAMHSAHSAEPIIAARRAIEDALRSPALREPEGRDAEVAGPPQIDVERLERAITAVGHDYMAAKVREWEPGWMASRIAAEYARLASTDKPAGAG